MIPVVTARMTPGGEGFAACVATTGGNVAGEPKKGPGEAADAAGAGDWGEGGGEALDTGADVACPVGAGCGGGASRSR